MKPEVSERLFIEALFNNSKEKLGTSSTSLKNIERLTGDASTRRYYRLFTEKYSFVVCLDNPSESGSNPFITVQGFLNEHDIRVPIIHDMDLKKGYLLEEDLGDVTLLQYLSQIESLDDELEIFKKIMDSLIKLHQISDKDIQAENIFCQKFNEEKLNQEIDFTDKFFLDKFLKIEDQSAKDIITQEFKEINKRIASEKMVFTHRDFHSRNIMVKDEEFIIIDFQDARWGLPQYDLVSMLEDCYYDLASENKNKLIEYYYEGVGPSVHGQKDFAHFKSLYNDMTLQRVFKAIGSFSYIYETRKDVRYVKNIGFAMEKIKQVLLTDPKYKNLRTTLFKYYYES